jgi:hypothetical protein
MENRLALKWTEGLALAEPPPRSPVRPVPGPLVQPPAEQRGRLSEMAQLGYYRGIINLLDELQRENAAYQPWCERLRLLARQYQFDALRELLDAAPENS